MALLTTCSGIELDKDTVGIAYPHAMCNSELSVGVTQDGGRSLTATANTAAHELGHLLNMGHDGKLATLNLTLNLILSTERFSLKELHLLPHQILLAPVMTHQVGASWQLPLNSLLPLNGAAAASQISKKASKNIAWIAVSLMSLP